MSYDPIEFPFQVHNDAKVVETAYLCPEGLPWGATLEITPAQANIAPGRSAIFTCRLTLDPAIIRPGCSSDEGFLLTAWRIAHDADEQWGSCFYFIRPRVRTKIAILRATWHENQLSVYGQLSLDTDQQVQLNDHRPLQVRVRLEFVEGRSTKTQWVNVNVQPVGAFALHSKDYSGPVGAELRIQAWFDRTDLLASSRSNLFGVTHTAAPVINW